MYGIVTADKVWIYFESPNRKKLWMNPDGPSILTVVLNPFGGKAMFCVQ